MRNLFFVAIITITANSKLEKGLQNYHSLKYILLHLCTANLNLVFVSPI